MMFRLITLLIALFSIGIINAEPQSCTDKQCIAVVDAGSTGSRLHVYSYSLDAHNSPINIQEIFTKKVQPGFASINEDQSTINRYAEALFSDSSFNNIPLYFYATAGMRLLPYQTQQAYYDKLTQWFSSQNQWQLISAKTIKGTEEGLLGWLAVNYQLGRLASSDQPLVGVMDTGGASVQISFPVTHSQSINPDDLLSIQLYGRTIQVFSHSFLGLGQNEITSHFLDVAECFPNDYPLPSGAIGQGNVGLCGTATSSLINGVHHVDATIKPAIKSNPIKNWYAIGGISYMVQTPPLAFTNHQFTNTQLAEQTNNELCHPTWPTLMSQYPTNTNLSNSCLNASYFYTLLVEGYGINKDEPVQYFPVNQSSNDWTLGVILHHE